MEQKGEFEQRPEVKPAEQIPFSKPRTSKLPWILCVVFALAAVGLSIFLVLGGMKKDEKTNCETVASNQGGDSSTGGTGNSNESLGTIRKVLKIVNDAEGVAKRYAGNNYGERHEGYGVLYEFEKGYSTGLDWSFGFELSPVNSSNSNSIKEFASKVTENASFKSDLTAAMKKHGLSESNLLDGGAFQEFNYAYYKSDDGYLCVYSISGMFYMSCGHTSWISEEKKELVKELTDKFVEGMNIQRTEGVPIYLNASPDNIASNKSNTYQILSASVSDAGVMFYRKGKDGEWKYAFGGQQAPDCDQYTGELKEAFEGMTCWHWQTGTQDTVKK